MPNYNLTYKPFGGNAILIEWPSEINESILYDIIAFKNKIENEINLQDIIVGYNSLVLVSSFKIERIHHKISSLKELYNQPSKTKIHKTTHWEIPVCYDQQFGIDLEEISQKKSITKDKIIQIHSSTIYTVYFIGFLPGFLYLGGLDEQIVVPRKSTPRLRVPKGAVAIGGSQTGIYPNESSGGWNIIGNSPISFFDAQKVSPCFAKTGDKISFKSVSYDEYKMIKEKVNSNVYQLKTIL